MPLVILYIATLVVFAILDAIGISQVILPVMERDAGHLMAETPRVLPALIFYFGYIAGLVGFVTYPALTAGLPYGRVALRAAAFGAVAYGTYEFTNLAILADWTWAITLTDMAWGIVLNALGATGGLWLARAFGGRSSA